jgi:ferredoxin like protein
MADERDDGMSLDGRPNERAVGAVSMSLEEKLYRVRYEVDSNHPHIRLDEAVCRNCTDRICTFICPARVYVPSSEDLNIIQVHHENCLECGTCRVACTREGVRWEYPNGGMGVKYRFG